MLAYRRKIKNDLFRSLLVLAAPTRLFACRNYRCGSPHVRFKLRFARFHQLSCRTVPVQIWGADSKIKNDQKWSLFILAAQIKNNANTIIQEIINIAEMLTDADIAIYRMPDGDFAQLPRILENNIQSKI